MGDAVDAEEDVGSEDGDAVDSDDGEEEGDYRSHVDGDTFHKQQREEEHSKDWWVDNMAHREHTFQKEGGRSHREVEEACSE